MQILRHLKNFPQISQSIVTIGNFDGIHIGHQKMLKKAQEMAKIFNCPLIVLTFEPYPKEFFLKTLAPARITNFREKMTLLKSLNIDYVVCLRFNNQWANLSPQEFITEILVNKFCVCTLLVGEDFHFGKNREGNYQTLLKAAKIYHFKLVTIENILFESQRISSTWVREALANSEFKLAESLLGRPFAFLGRVIHGDKRGRTWGIPTANIALHRLTLPLKGIFLVKVKIIHPIEKGDKPFYFGVASIGYRPMYHTPKGLLEIHLFDFNANLYGALIQVIILKKIRDEEFFASESELIQQIHCDIEVAKKAIPSFI